MAETIGEQNQARVGGEWTALREARDRAYCDYVDRLRRPECLGYEQKLKEGSFGKAELDAHTRAGELLGRHRAFAEALAAAAPAPPPLGPNCDKVRHGMGYSYCPNCPRETVAPPPQDGQGAERLGPPRGGSSSDLADSDSLKVGRAPKVGWMDSIDFEDELGNVPNSEIHMNEAQCRQQHACIVPPDNPGHYCYPKRVYVFDADAYDATKPNPTPTTGLPEAVAGNASAPVGEPHGWNAEQILVYIWQLLSGEQSEQEYPYSKFANSEAGKRLRLELAARYGPGTTDEIKHLAGQVETLLGEASTLQAAFREMAAKWRELRGRYLRSVPSSCGCGQDEDIAKARTLNDCADELETTLSLHPFQVPHAQNCNSVLFNGLMGECDCMPSNSRSAAEPAWKVAMSQFMKANIRYREALEQAAHDLDITANVCEKASGNEAIRHMARVVRRYAGSARSALTTPSPNEGASSSADARTEVVQKEVGEGLREACEKLAEEILVQRFETYQSRDIAKQDMVELMLAALAAPAPKPDLVQPGDPVYKLPDTLLDGAIVVVRPTDLRNRVGMFLVEHHNYHTKSKPVSIGKVQDLICEFIELERAAPKPAPPAERAK